MVYSANRETKGLKAARGDKLGSCESSRNKTEDQKVKKDLKSGESK